MPLLLENGSLRLLENGSVLLLEGEVVTPPGEAINLSVTFGPVYPQRMLVGSVVFVEVRRVLITLPDGEEAEREALGLTCRLALCVEASPASGEWRPAVFEERADGLSIRSETPVAADDLAGPNLLVFAEVAQPGGETIRARVGLFRRSG